MTVPVCIFPEPGVIHVPHKRLASTPPRRAIGAFLLQLPRTTWMMLDVLLVCAGTMLGDRYFVWWEHNATILTQYHRWLSGGVLAFSVIIAGHIFGLYESTTLWARSRIFVRSLLTVVLAMLLTWLVIHLFMYSELSRRAAATGVVFFLVTASTVRFAAHYAVSDIRRGLLVIGQGPLTGTIVRSIRRNAAPGYRLVGVALADRRGYANVARDIPIAGDINDIEQICRDNDVTEVVVSQTDDRSMQYEKAALTCLRMGCRVIDENTFYESTYGEVPVSHISPRWFLTADLKGHRQEHAMIKRVLDCGLSMVGMLLTFPLFPLIAALIRLQGPGPTFYSQVRVGRGGKRFVLHKFRTMRANAEDGGSTWATADDPRVTRFGRFLRLSRLDELPQLWNILIGDMSIVGPRPERPEFVTPLTTLIPFYDERHLVKPGLTGWAQINYRYGASVADARRKLQLDLYYIKHMSLELDLVILLRTFGIFFRGAR
jgi:exopolysaccharide biosynthesis polyprenyl glycosylphosphotransferase